MIEALRKIDRTPAQVRKTLLVLGGALLLVGLLLLWRHKAHWVCWAGTGVVLGAAGAACPRLFTWLHVLWIGLSLALGYVMSRVVLTLLFFVLITPMAVLARLTGKRFLTGGPEATRASYWERRQGPPRDPAGCEKQF